MENVPGLRLGLYKSNVCFGWSGHRARSLSFRLRVKQNEIFSLTEAMLDESPTTVKYNVCKSISYVQTANVSLLKLLDVLLFQF